MSKYGGSTKVASSKYTTVEAILAEPNILEAECYPLTDEELNVSLESSVVSSK